MIQKQSNRKSYTRTTPLFIVTICLLFTATTHAANTLKLGKADLSIVTKALKDNNLTAAERYLNFIGDNTEIVHSREDLLEDLLVVAAQSTGDCEIIKTIIDKLITLSDIEQGFYIEMSLMSLFSNVETHSVNTPQIIRYLLQKLTTSDRQSLLDDSLCLAAQANRKASVELLINEYNANIWTDEALLCLSSDEIIRQFIQKKREQNPKPQPAPIVYNVPIKRPTILENIVMPSFAAIGLFTIGVWLSEKCKTTNQSFEKENNSPEQNEEHDVPKDAPETIVE